MRCLKCLIQNGKIVSPGVGQFYCLSSSMKPHSDEHIIGVLKRLDEMLYLVLPESVEVKEITAVDGMFVMSGDVLAISAEFCSSEDKSQDVVCVRTPSDGFICLTDAAGNALKKKGDILSSKDVTAILEFMKIRMDLMFDGPNGSVFVRYLCSDHAAVRCGDPIYEYKKSK